MSENATHLSDFSSVLESDVTKCTTCSEVYTRPHLLPCLHSICQPCLQRHLAGHASNSSDTILAEHELLDQARGKDTKRDANNTFNCPQCQTKIAVPSEGLQGFHPNHFLQSLVDLLSYQSQTEKFCDYCHYDKKSLPAVARCLDCLDDMCMVCMDAHRRTKLTRQHQVALFKDLQTGKHNRTIRANQQVTCPDHAGESIKFYCNECDTLICDKCLTSQHGRHKHSAINTAIKPYRLQTEKSLQAVSDKIPFLEEHLSELANYELHIKDRQRSVKLSVDNQAEALHKLVDMYRDTLLAKLEKATLRENQLVKKRREHLVSNLVAFRSTSDYLSMLLKHGKDTEILGACHVVTDRLARLARLNVKNLSNKAEFSFNPGSLTAQNLEELFGKVETRILPFETPSAGQKSECLVLLTDTAPSGVVAVELVSSFSCQSEADTRDAWPTGLAIGKNGSIVLVDRQNRSVKVYNKTCSFVREFGHDGDETLGCPFDVAVLKDGRMAVTDYDKEEVKIFSGEGKVILSITENLKYPRGLTVNKNDEIIVLDAHHRHMTVHDSNTGALLRTIQGKGHDDLDLFTEPFYVTTNENGDIIATDWVAPNIKLFDAKGNYITDYGTYGCRKDQVLQPHGICTDASGYIYVADNQNHRIHLLDPEGQFIRFLVTKHHRLWHPMAVAIDQEGRLVVTEALGKVKVFKYR